MGRIIICKQINPNVYLFLKMTFQGTQTSDQSFQAQVKFWGQLPQFNALSLELLRL